MDFKSHQTFVIRQRFEIAELIGFETRNKYEILSEQGESLLFAAEQHKGILGFLFRQMLGHWRTFEIQFFNTQRQPVFSARHPFRFFFQRLEVSDSQGKFLGAIQQRFSFFRKCFDFEDAQGNVYMRTRSAFWKFWTFPVVSNAGQEVAIISKKWSGILNEMFTDRDHFMVKCENPSLTDTDRKLLLSAALFVDLQYFEQKARSGKD